MRIDNEQISQLIIFCKKQWKPLALCGLIFFSLLITLTIPSNAKKSNIPPINTQGRIPNDGSEKKPDSEKKPFNLLGFLFNQKKEESKQQDNSQALNNLPNVISPQTTLSTVTQLKSDGTKVVQKLDGKSVISTAQGTINPNVNLNNVISGNVQQDNISMVFLNPDGTTTTYIPPGTPPDEIRWAEYTNHNDKYAIIYPYNWKFFYSVSDGHEGIALYPPGVDPLDSKSPYIGFGMTDDFHVPIAGEAQGTYLTPIIVDGETGGLYTNGPLGNSFIASVISYNGKYFGLGSSKSDATFAYVYFYMINSINFNAE